MQRQPQVGCGLGSRRAFKRDVALRLGSIYLQQTDGIGAVRVVAFLGRLAELQVVVVGGRAHLGLAARGAGRYPFIAYKAGNLQLVVGERRAVALLLRAARRRSWRQHRLPRSTLQD